MVEEVEEAEVGEAVAEEDQFNPPQPNQQPLTTGTGNWKGKNLPFSLETEQKLMSLCMNSNSTNSSTPTPRS